MQDEPDRENSHNYYHTHVLALLKAFNKKITETYICKVLFYTKTASSDESPLVNIKFSSVKVCSKVVVTGEKPIDV